MADPAGKFVMCAVKISVLLCYCFACVKEVRVLRVNALVCENSDYSI